MKSELESLTRYITVVVADDHPVVREGLTRILNAQKDIRVVASAADGEEVTKLYHQFLPDVLILDLRLPKKDGLQVLNDLMASGSSKPRVMIITTFDCEEAIFKAARAGAKGYLVKGAAPEQIRESVRRVAAGESVLSSSLTAKLAESIARPRLSKRERQVLPYLANGRSNKEIAQILYISEHTAKAHVRSIMTKLNADSRTQVIAIATKHGLIKTVPG